MISRTLSVADIVPRHTGPVFDLGTEPWVPVIVDGEARQWGLVEVLEQAHRITGFAGLDPMTELALTRYLLTLGYVAFAYDPDYDWDAVAAGDKPMSSGGLAAVVYRMRGRWWLFHPDTPFLQIPEAREWNPKTVTGSLDGSKDLLGDVTHDYQVLLPHVPSGNNEAIWYRGISGGLTFAETALALVVQHYAALPGNVANVQLPGASKPFKFSNGGLIFAGPRSMTHVMLAEPTLAATLVRNFTRMITDHVTPEHRCFWEDPLGGGARLEDPLYRFSVSGAAAYVCQPADGTFVTHIIRTPVPVAAGTMGALLTAARLCDPHTLRSLKKAGGSAGELLDVLFITLPAAASMFETVWPIYKTAAGAAGLEPCVLQPATLTCRRGAKQAPITATTLETGGNATGVRLEAVVRQTIDPAPLLLDAIKTQELRTMLLRLAAPAKSVWSQLRHHITEALTGPHTSKSTAANAAVARAETSLWTAYDAILTATYHEIVEAKGSVDVDVLIASTKLMWIDVGVHLYKQACRQYETSPEATRRIIEHESSLRKALWKLL